MQRNDEQCREMLITKDKCREMQRNAKKCKEMQRNLVQQTGIILAKIRALDGRNYGRNSNFIFNFNFLKKSKLAKSWWAPTIL